MYKIVDTFNGWESDKNFSTLEEAMNELFKDKQEFFKYNSSNCIYKKTVIPSSLKWSWNEIENRWEWS